MGDCCSRKVPNEDELEHLKDHSHRNDNKFHIFYKFDKVFDPRIQNKKNQENLKKLRDVILSLIKHCKAYLKKQKGKKARIFLEVQRSYTIPARGENCCCGCACEGRIFCGCCNLGDSLAFVNVKYKESFNQDSDKVHRVKPEWFTMFKIKDIPEETENDIIDISIKISPDKDHSNNKYPVKLLQDEAVHDIFMDSWRGRAQLIKNPELYWSNRLDYYERVLKHIDIALSSIMQPEMLNGGTHHQVELEHDVGYKQLGNNIQYAQFQEEYSEQNQETSEEEQDTEQKPALDVLGRPLTNTKYLRNHGFGKQVTRQF